MSLDNILLRQHITKTHTLIGKNIAGYLKLFREINKKKFKSKHLTHLTLIKNKL
jgi:hypothetical protein